MAGSALLLLWALVIGTPVVGPVAPTDSLPGGLYAEVHTARGLITLRLEPMRAPLATAGFVGLAEGTIENAAFPIGRPYYDGTPFHRVVPGHVIQAGAPDTAEAAGPGYVYPNEIHAALSHARAGVLGVANSGPHTNSGQFYITLDDRSYLDFDYIVFGEVVEGMEVVHAIVQDDVVDSVRIVRVGAEAQGFRPDTDSFREMIRRAEVRVAEHEKLRRRAEEEWLARNVPGLEGGPSGVRTVLLEGAAGDDVGDGVEDGPRATGWDGILAGDAHPARYRGRALRYVGHLLEHEGRPLEELAFGSGPDGRPGFFDPAMAFPLAAEGPDINPGLDQVLARLTPGEGRIAVVPAELGYGSSGHYGPDRPGEPRFAISPNSLLVYEVEILPQRR